MKSLFAVLALFVAVALPSYAEASCPPSTAFLSRSSDATASPITYKTSYSVDATYDVFFFLFVPTTAHLTGNHTLKVEIKIPAGTWWQTLPATGTDTISPTTGTAVTCGRLYQLSQSLAVAGTVIESSGVYGTWTASFIFDGSTASPSPGVYSFDLTNP